MDNNFLFLCVLQVTLANESIVLYMCEGRVLMDKKKVSFQLSNMQSYQLWRKTKQNLCAKKQRALPKDSHARVHIINLHSFIFACTYSLIAARIYLQKF